MPVGLQSPPCRASVPLPITEAALDADTLKTAKMSFDCVKTKMGLPGSVGPSEWSTIPPPGAGRGVRPAYPTRKVPPQAEVILPTAPPGCWQTRGHINALTEGEKGNHLPLIKGWKLRSIAKKAGREGPLYRPFGSFHQK